MAKTEKDHGKFIILISVIVIVLDQILKIAIRKSMALGQSIPVINNIFHITYITNTGAGFGILKDMNFLLMSVSFIVIIFIVFYLVKNKPKNKIELTSFSLILGGAVGNIIDRIIFGKVTDFIDFRIWPAFNIADSAITVGAIILVIYFWKK